MNAPTAAHPKPKAMRKLIFEEEKAPVAPVTDRQTVSDWLEQRLADLSLTISVEIPK